MSLGICAALGYFLFLSPFQTVCPERESDEQARRVNKGASFSHRRDGVKNKNGLQEGRSIFHRFATGGNGVVQLLCRSVPLGTRSSGICSKYLVLPASKPDNDILLSAGEPPPCGRNVIERGLTGVMASMAKRALYAQPGSQVFGRAQSKGLGEVDPG